MAEQKQTYTVLICETDEAAVAQIRQALEAVAWPIVGAAASEDEAAQLTKQHKPDIIVMALTLEEEQDGLAATRRISKTKASAIVLLSADTSEEVVQAAVKAGACGLLAMPLDAEEIVSRLRKAKEVHDIVRDAFEALDEMETERVSGSDMVTLFNRAEEVLWKVKHRSTGAKAKKNMEFIH